jgi:methyltransferase (TIGR00027 family)
MKSDRPSLTAGFVAWARGVASAHPLVHPALHDDAARELLPAAFGWAVPRPDRPWAWASQQALRALSAGLVDHLAMRTTAIDLALAEALAGGVRQVVLLGAGLDARAYRLPGLATSAVFEVDYPSTQQFKHRQGQRLTPLAQRLVHVSVDFATDSLAAALATAGHSTTVPTFWIWEGVTMYLPREATRSTLAAVGLCSSVGSRIAVTYSDAELARFPFPIRQVVHAGFQLLGEPMVGQMAPEQMRALLSEVGFSVVSDEHSLDWERRFGGSSRVAFAFRQERLAVAEKRKKVTPQS